MRKQFATTVQEILGQDPQSALFLGDIGVYGFKDALQKYPTRAFNIGILEQATMGVAAGYALRGYHPIIHTIAPFLVERALEQIKIDFGYQKLNGNLVTIGASYDYTALGCTHHCPGDVQIITSIPNSNVIIPGSANELDTLFRSKYTEGLNYFRLTDNPHSENINVTFGKNLIVKKGNSAVVVAVGPTLSNVLEAVSDLDVTVVYCTTVQPFDSQTLFELEESKKIITVEPYYTGVLASKIMLDSNGGKISLSAIGVSHNFHTKYGTYNDHLVQDGLDPIGIRKIVLEMIKK